MKSLSHKSITALKDIYRTKEHVYIVMELVSGGELLERIIKKGFFYYYYYLHKNIRIHFFTLNNDANSDNKSFNFSN